jgi:hypothetical protein
MQNRDKNNLETNLVVFFYIIGVILMMIGIVFLLPGLTGSVVGSRLGSDLFGSIILGVGVLFVLGAWKFFIVR